MISINGKDRDRWLPYLLVAYREGRQAATGYSSIERLYCRQVQESLEVLGRPTAGEASNCSPFVLQMREKMEQTTKRVRKNLEEMQRQQTLYDRMARRRSFESEDKLCYCFQPQRTSCWPSGRGPTPVIRGSLQKFPWAFREPQQPDRVCCDSSERRLSQDTSGRPNN